MPLDRFPRSAQFLSQLRLVNLLANPAERMRVGIVVFLPDDAQDRADRLPVQVVPHRNAADCDGRLRRPLSQPAAGLAENDDARAQGAETDGFVQRPVFLASPAGG
ncbi:MAG: hypothetical protein ABSD47_10700 [Candidatus Methylomirabilota bacterium]